MAGANKAVKAAAARLAKLRKEQARVVRKAHDFVARAEQLTEAVGAAEQSLQEAMAQVASGTGTRGAATPVATAAAARRGAAPRSAPAPRSARTPPATGTPGAATRRSR